MTTPDTDHAIFEAGDVLLQSGATLRDAHVAYKTYGALDRARGNAIVFCTPFGAQHRDIEHMIRPGAALDPDKYFIVVPNLFGNGLSSSPSNSATYQDCTIYDNVMVQRRLLTEALGVSTLQLACGWSMGGLQAYHWAALFPDDVRRMACICGAARIAPHNFVFLEGVKAALTADPAFKDGGLTAIPERGLRAVGRIYAGWALSQAFYRERLWSGLGYASLEDFLAQFWEASFLRRDARNVLAHIWTWQHADVAANDRFAGDFARALGSIRARALVMPCDQDLYFTVEDNRREVEQMRSASLKVIPSMWGHRAGNPAQNPQDYAFVNAALKELLSDHA